MSIAFANASGVSLIEDALRPVRTHVDAFVGIRNDVTTAQGLKRMLPVVNRLFIVDTGSRNRIFHPKIYLARSRSAAHLVVGSANLTMGGLWNNIEASLKLEVNLADAAERSVIESLEAQFDALPLDYPEHVVAVTTGAQIDALLAAGRVIDESVAERPRPVTRVGDRDPDRVPRMPLVLKIKPPPVQRPRQPARIGASAVRPRAATPTALAGYELLWESRELTERDLNIPSSLTTAPTGSMLFKKGRLEGIDQRHFFRDEVFSGLDWQPDARPDRRRWQRAQATFRIIIKNIYYGEFDLRLSHNSDTTSRTYLQNNSTTQLHWGTVAEYIRHRDLLARTLYCSIYIETEAGLVISSSKLISRLPASTATHL